GEAADAEDGRLRAVGRQERGRAVELLAVARRGGGEEAAVACAPGGRGCVGDALLSPLRGRRAVAELLHRAGRTDRADYGVADGGAAEAGPGRIADGAADADRHRSRRADQVPLAGVDFRRVAGCAERAVVVRRRAVTLEGAGGIEVDPRTDRARAAGRCVRVADRPADRPERPAFVDAEQARVAAVTGAAYLTAAAGDGAGVRGRVAAHAVLAVGVGGALDAGAATAD